MDKLIKGLIFDNKATIAILDGTEMVNEAIRLHKLSSVAAAALGRTLCCAAYMCSNLKDADSSLSVSIKADGAGGNMMVSGNSSLFMRGYVSNPQTELLPRADGKLDVSGFVGKNGYISVIRDDGEGQPFIGSCELVSGEIGEDFVNYYYKSEQIPATLAVGVNMKGGKCLGAGGVFITLMPDYDGETVKSVEAVMQNFSRISALITELGADGVADRYFDVADRYELKAVYKCNCSREYIADRVKTLGKSELEGIIAEQGKISVHCDYCNSDYEYFADDVKKMFCE